ncbi:MAG: DUF3427 domain-containing protein [Pseudomonadota bacterium]
MTLDKSDFNPDAAYNDYFEDGLFYWESQKKNTPESKTLRRLMHADYIPLLFVREKRKVKSKTQPFFYAGRLLEPEIDPDSNQPVKFAFRPVDLDETVPESLLPVVAWKPAPARRRPPAPEFSHRLSTKHRGQGIQANPRVRKAIELHAMEIAKKSYEQEGYKVQDVSSSHPYDLLCKKQSAEPRRVEVKGTTSGPCHISLTYCEVRAARQCDSITDLFIVHDIEIEFEQSRMTARRGVVCLIRNWVPEDADLQPTQYRYRVQHDRSANRYDTLVP